MAKRTAKRNLARAKIFFSENKPLSAMIAIFVLGLALGSISLGMLNTGNQSAIGELMATYISDNQTLSIMSLFTKSFLNAFLCLLAVYFCGLCAIGLPVIILVPFIKGISNGVILGYLYSTYGFTGFGYSLLVVLPALILLTAILLFACQEAIHMTSNVFFGVSGSKSGKMPGVSSDIRKFSKRFLIFLLLTVAACALEGVSQSVFSSVFKL